MKSKEKRPRLKLQLEEGHPAFGKVVIVGFGSEVAPNASTGSRQFRKIMRAATIWAVKNEAALFVSLKPLAQTKFVQRVLLRRGGELLENGFILRTETCQKLCPKKSDRNEAV